MSKTEQYIRTQIEGELREGETILAYATLGDVVGRGLIAAFKARGYLAALTNERLVLLVTPLGAFRAMLQNEGTESIERSEIVGVDGLTLKMRDGGVRKFVGQRSDVAKPTLLWELLQQDYGGTPAAAELRAGQRRSRWWRAASAVGAVSVGLWWAWTEGQRSDDPVELVRPTRLDPEVPLVERQLPGVRLSLP